MIKTAFGVGVVVVAVFVSIFALAFGSYELYAYFAPKYRAVDNRIFHESEQYNEGMLRDLAELQRQYVTADPAGKAALRPIIRHRFEVYPESKMPADLRDFYQTIK
jgi:hypothetical protein